MKERFALLAAYFKEKFAIGKKSGKEKRKGLILSIVALVEVLAIAIVSVSAWVETISTIKLDLNNGTIDNYVFTNANIGYGNGYDGNTIDLTKYFRQAGDVHLASATSANGTDVYFPTLTANGAPSGAYRKATVNDKNVNYIDFSFNVTAKGTKASFYFDKVPTIKVNDADADEDKLRVSFVCYGSNTVVCGKSDSNAEVVAGTNLNIKGQENVKTFGSYTGSTAESPLFTVPADSKPHKVTMRVWLQDDSRNTKYAGQTVTIDNFKLITQSPQAGELTFYDKTTGDPSLGAGWATKNNRAIWINQDGKSEYKKLSKDSSGNYFIKLGSDYTDNPNATVTFYSCESTVTSNPQNSFVAKWTTTLQTAVDADSQTFTAYGYKDSSNNGYGTWGEVQKILLSSEDASTLPMTQVDGKYLAVDMYVQGSSTPIAMTFEPNDNASLSGWVAYLPNPNSDAARSITFKFTYNGKDYSVSAPNRNSSVNYVITSQNTGYWAPPAIVSVYSPCKDEKDNNAVMGTVSVTGGMDGATRVKVTAGTKVTLTATPKSSKYTFRGWYSDASFTNPVELDNGGITATDTTKEYKFYARFERQYLVEGTAVTGASVDDSTGGTVTMEGKTSSKVSQNFLEGSSTSLTATARTGYDFVGWYYDEACTKSYSKENVIELNNIQENHSYYAQFKIKTFTVKAVAKQADGADVGTVEFTAPEAVAPGTSVTVTVNYGGSATFVAKPSKDGYKFVAWTDAEGNQIDLNSEYTRKNIKNDTTLYAKFELINLDLKVYPVLDGKVNETVGTLNLGLGSAVTKIETTVKWGSTVTLKATAKETVSSQYKFEGWYTDLACTKKADSTILNNCAYSSDVIDTKAIKANLTLYANFIDVTPRTVTAKAYYNGAVDATAGTVKAGSSAAGATSQTIVTNGKSVTLKATLSDENMYIFSGWYDENGTLKSNELEYTTPKVTANCTYHAKFMIKTFEIKAVSVGSHGTVKFTSPVSDASKTSVSVTVNYNDSVTFLATPSASEGYKFVGWYDDYTGERVSTSEQYTVSKVTSKLTLNAKFELIKYKVNAQAVTDETISTTGGTIEFGNVADANAVEWGTAITLTANAKTGYEFKGWYSDAACTKAYVTDNAVNPLDITVKSNVTVYAKFAKKTDSTTTIYFESRNWDKYNAYVYASSDKSKYYSKPWPGTEATLDSDTGYYKYEFNTSDDGNFRVIVNNGSGSQYPGVDQPGLEGTIGKTYIFKSDNALEEFDPEEFDPNAKVTITFDQSNVAWVTNGYARLFAYDTGKKKEYEMTYSNSKWTVSVPATVNNITFYRCTPKGFGTDKAPGDGSAAGYWNRWLADNRGTKITYKATSDGGGSWQ